MNGDPEGDSQGDPGNKNTGDNSTVPTTKINSVYTILQRIVKPTTNPKTTVESKQESFLGRLQGGPRAANNEGQQQLDDEGWHTAMPRWKKRIPLNRKTKQFSSPEVEKAYIKLFKERKCLRCFASGHQKAQCREPLKCLKCFKYGHVAGRCTSTIKPREVKPKPKSPVTKPTQPGRTYTQATRNSLDMGNLFLDERPDEADVFLPAYSQVSPVNAYLERAAYINILEGEVTDDMPENIQATLVAHHGGPLARYRILKEGRTPILLVYQDALTRDAVVQEGPYYMTGARFEVVAWSATIGMAFQPPGHQTWIRLHNLPFQFWNPSALNNITARLGTIKEIMPYGLQANQSDNVTLLVASQHPRTMPKNLRVREGDYTRRVRVQVMGSRPAQPGYFQPPPNPPQRRQHWERQQAARQHPYQNTPRRTSPTSGDSSEASSRWPRSRVHKAGTVRKVWVKKSVLKPVDKSGQKPWVSKPVTKLVGKPVTTIATIPRPAEVTMVKLWKKQKYSNTQDATLYKATADQVSAIQTVVRFEGDRVHILLSNGTYCKVSFILQSMRRGLSPLSINWPVLTPIDKLPATVVLRLKKLTGWDRELLTINDIDVGNQKEMIGTGPSIVKVLPLVKEGGGSAIFNNAGPMENGGLTGPKLGPREVNSNFGPIRSLEFGPKEIYLNFGPVKRGFTTELELQAKDAVEDLNEGEFVSPPPSFLTPSRAVQEGFIEVEIVNPIPSLASPSEVRRSPRLKEKSDGSYVTVMNKARVVQGYEAEKARTRKARVKPQRPRPEYLDSMAPLSRSQAGVAVMAAGVELTEELQARIEAVLDNSNGMRVLRDSDP